LQEQGLERLFVKNTLQPLAVLLLLSNALKEQKHIKIPQVSLDTLSKAILIREFAGATARNDF
jgi:hypothetical protein